MSPRKKSKPNNKAPAAANNPGPDPPATQSTSDNASKPPSTTETSAYSPSNSTIERSESSLNESASAASSSQPSLNKKPSRKWYGGVGSWRAKASPIARISKESIGVTSGGTSELPGEETTSTKEKSPKNFLTKRKSSKGDAIPASMTKLTISSNGSVDRPSNADASKDSTEPPPPKIEEPPLPPDPPKSNSGDGGERTIQNTGTFGWRSWWSRPDGYNEGAKSKEAGANDTTEAQKTPLPGATPSEERAGKEVELTTSTTETPMPELATESQDETKRESENTSTDTAVQGSSWFWFWSSAQNAKINPPAGPPPTDDKTKAGTTELEDAKASEPASLATKVPDPATENDTVKTSSKTPPKSSGWAFWTRDQSKAEDKTDSSTPHKQVGEIAVSDTPSQSKPEAVQYNEQEAPKEAPKEPAQQKPEKPKAKSLRGRLKGTKETKDSSAASTPATTTPSRSPTRPDTAPAAQPGPKQVPKAKESPNLIFPEFRNTYHLVQKPSYWQQIRKYFLGDEPAMPHLHINPAPPRIKKAIAIGVHGYFPAPLIQKVLGQPTGTSIRFANAAAAAIQEWTEARGYSAEIEKVALEGEGFIADRVNTLWKLLLNWIEHIKSADFILVACHSQGVPVAIMLVAKLIQFGCVSATRIGICAMAGVNLGPFTEYKTKYFGATAAELFQFSDSKSLVSQMYLAALDEVLRYGVRILYVGSIDDQLVSLESSTFSTLSHPYIYRAVFVDGRIHAPDFLTHLVGFALKLRNLGLPDHGLIRELSPAIAGSLYSGEGHSRIYDDPALYMLAVQHALETTSLPIQPQVRPSTSGLNVPSLHIPKPGENNSDPYALKIKDYESVGGGNQNPYFLPWAMRGLLEEDFVKRELGKEVEELLSMFEEWKPVKKELKDVKYKLEGVRSKL